MIEPILILVLLIMILTSLFLGMLLYYAIRYVPFVPTPHKVTKKMVEAAKLKEHQKVYDLGCGDARLLHQAIQKETVKGVGIEASGLVYLLARLKSWRTPKEKLKLLWKDFYQVSLKEADVVFCYLFPKVMKKLEKKFREELQEGATIISYCFAIPGWTPIEVIPTNPKKPQNFLIYRYSIPQSLQNEA